MPLTTLRFRSIFFDASRAAAPLLVSDSRCAASVSRTDAPTSCVRSRTSAHCARTSEEASRRSAPRMASSRRARSAAAASGGERARDVVAVVVATVVLAPESASRVDDDGSSSTAPSSSRVSRAVVGVSVAAAPTRAKLSAAPANHVPRLTPSDPSPRSFTNARSLALLPRVSTPLFASRSRCSREYRGASTAASSLADAADPPNPNPRSADRIDAIAPLSSLVSPLVLPDVPDVTLGITGEISSPLANARASRRASRARVSTLPHRVTIAAFPPDPPGNSLERASNTSRRVRRRRVSIASTTAPDVAAARARNSLASSSSRVVARSSIVASTSARRTSSSARSISSSARSHASTDMVSSRSVVVRHSMPMMTMMTMTPRVVASASSSSSATNETRGTKRAVVTGANTGIGFETVRALRASGDFHTIVLACRDERRARDAIARLESPEETSASNATRLVFRALDLADVGSTRDFANAYLDDYGGALDVLVNNAGVMAVPSLERTRDGFELQVGVNHLGHHALTAGLFPALRASEDGRVATVSSEAHKIAARGLARDDLFGEKKYSAWGQYGQSKLANVLFAFELARRCPANVSSATLHPGAVDTELGRFLQPPEDEVIWWQKRLFEFVRDNFLKTPEQGAATSVYLARDIAKGEANGKYYVDCREKTPAKNCFDEEDAAWLWQRSAELTGVSFDSI